MFFGDCKTLKSRDYLGFNVNTMIIEKKPFRSLISNLANSSESEKIRVLGDEVKIIQQIMLQIVCLT